MIVCLSASYFAKGIANLLNKIYKPQIKKIKHKNILYKQIYVIVVTGVYDEE